MYDTSMYYFHLVCSCPLNDKETTAWKYTVHDNRLVSQRVEGSTCIRGLPAYCLWQSLICRLC
jgi:hypothetical protein